MRRALLLLSAALAGLSLCLGVSSSAAAQDAYGIHGTLDDQQDQPVEGVSITVSDASGAEIATVTTAADGTWAVPLDAEGDYVVTLDESTLPEGLVVRNCKPQLEVNVTGDRTALFPLDTQVDGCTPGESPGGGETPSSSEDESGEPGEESSESEDAAADDAAADEVGEIEGEGGATRAISLLVSGLHFGLMIALAAVGLSMVFGTTGLTNFAHGDLVTFGGVMALLFNVTFGLPVWIAAIAAVVLGAAFGWAQDWGLWSPLRRRGTGLVSMMIISIGVALLIRFATLFFVGGERQRYTEYVGQPPWDFGWLVISPKEVVTGLIALAVCVAVGLALVFTRLGKATRAVADNPSLAASTGIDVNKVVRLVWTIGGALAAMSGVFLSISDGVKFDMGQHLLLLVFAAVVLGGLGTAFGAFVGAMLIGVFVQMSTLVVAPELKYVGALAVLIIIMLTRPQGILGRRERIG
ncbi:branched-chain amino acid ABC transporter permease [Glycomyces artemisiae]|uniref:Branched-chain amino acid transport system permease protein n=1 Tax=Glycomyces artemisiae TaxID=1076443 RepID=A0A2T0UVU3_9ACTN|nr:branched-chain amino acid ABC transporter permease [Glycomyces artemisiae]PRY61968.1 branched-chain amino acid transport system permease protein [Glycomyces artemisiae]